MIKNIRLFLGLFPMLGSCSVYAPLQPGVPALYNKGQVEVAGSAYLSGRLEGSAAYSPIRHVLVRAAGGIRSDARTNYFRIRQWEASAGTYWPLANRWLIGALAGYGEGNGSRYFTEGDFESASQDTTVIYRYAARFHKLHGEAYVSYDAGWAMLGAAYRLSQVGFSSLTNEGITVPLRRMTRSEPMFFLRLNDRQGSIPWGQLQLATSLSWSPDFLDARNVAPTVAHVKETRVFTSIGVVIYPHKFSRRK